MKPRAALTFLVAAVAGALVWLLSPMFTGQAEPWDADGPFYVASLLIAGLGAGGLVPKPLWAHYLGAVVGQLTYEFLFLKVGPLFLLGAVFLLGYSLIFLLGAAIAAHVRFRYAKRSTA